MVKDEESNGDVTEGVGESLMEAVGKEVKREIGEATTLHLFDQRWAKAEEKYKAVREKLLSKKFCKGSKNKCHLCDFQAGSEDSLVEHLMTNHVFD